MKRKIKKVAILGSGVMGSAIACHFANIGCEVILLDLAPTELLPEEQAQGLTLDHSKVKNRIVETAFQKCIKSNPAPLYTKKYQNRITVGNFTDDWSRISDCDWVLEAIIEDLGSKQHLYEQVEKHRRPGTLVSSNTSGIPIQQLIQNRSEDFKKHFAGTHFFNPPRYLPLLEIIPTSETDPQVTDFLLHYGDLFLGKTTVLCKDTPAFIGNRVAVWGLMKVIHSMNKYGLTIDEVDKLTGPIIGRPKSATFRTSDLVGLDTMVKVSTNLYEALLHDESRDNFKLPDVVHKLVEANRLGEKTGAGFYKKIKDKAGKTEIHTLDLKTLDYKPRTKVKFATLDSTKNLDTLSKRLPALLAGKDKAGEFYRDSLFSLFQYASLRIPEITTDLYQIDEAVSAGFGWEMGPFAMWESLGVQQTLPQMETLGYKPAPWVYDMVSAQKTFFNIEKGTRQYYDPDSGLYKTIPSTQSLILLDNLSDQVIWKNDESKVTDLGDGIINFSWHSKSYTLGTSVIQGLNTALDLAEKDYQGLILGHQGADFSLGANLGLVFMLAIEQDYDELTQMVHSFQQSVMRLRYSSIPVIACPRGRTLGGGCEITLHADQTQTAAETYMGLVEIGVGLIPAGGGTKELTQRISHRKMEGDVELNALQNTFMNIATAKVSLSAEEALEMGLLMPGDRISINPKRQLTNAKTMAMDIAKAGYKPPLPASEIRVQGQGGLALFAAGVNNLKIGGYVSSHDAKIAMKIAHVMCGGNLSYPQTVSEQYLLDLEREAFISLCGEKKTLERIQAILAGKKPLRN